MKKKIKKIDKKKKIIKRARWALFIRKNDEEEFLLIEDELFSLEELIRYNKSHGCDLLGMDWELEDWG